MRTLEVLIEDTQDKLERITISGTEYNLMDYIHGRCQVFAQALHEELGYEMQFLWDTDYWFENANGPSIVLVHAFCILPKGIPFKGKLVDARGAVSKRMIEHEYECNYRCYENYTLERLSVAYKNKILVKPTKSEIKAVRKYIRENITRYQ